MESHVVKPLSLSLLRRAARELSHTGHMIKVTVPRDSEADARDLPGFKPLLSYQSVQVLAERLALNMGDVLFKPMYPNELGRVERFVIVLSERSRDTKVHIEADGQELVYEVGFSVLS